MLLLIKKIFTFIFLSSKDVNKISLTITSIMMVFSVIGIKVTLDQNQILFISQNIHDIVMSVAQVIPMLSAIWGLLRKFIIYFRGDHPVTNMN